MFRLLKIDSVILIYNYLIFINLKLSLSIYVNLLFRNGLYQCAMDGTNVQCLFRDATWSVRSPRLYHDELYLLVNPVGGPHNACAKLLKVKSNDTSLKFFEPWSSARTEVWRQYWIQYILQKKMRFKDSF